MVDKGLQGNEKTEEYIKLLTREPSDEALSALRRKLKAGEQK